MREPQSLSKRIETVGVKLSAIKVDDKGVTKLLAAQVLELKAVQEGLNEERRASEAAVKAAAEKGLKKE